MYNWIFRQDFDKISKKFGHWSFLTLNHAHEIIQSDPIILPPMFISLKTQISERLELGLKMTKDRTFSNFFEILSKSCRKIQLYLKNTMKKISKGLQKDFEKIRPLVIFNPNTNRALQAPVIHPT